MRRTWTKEKEKRGQKEIERNPKPASIRSSRNRSSERATQSKTVTTTTTFTAATTTVTTTAVKNGQQQRNKIPKKKIDLISKRSSNIPTCSYENFNDIWPLNTRAPSTKVDRDRRSVKCHSKSSWKNRDIIMSHQKVYSLYQFIICWVNICAYHTHFVSIYMHTFHWEWRHSHQHKNNNTKQQ